MKYRSNNHRGKDKKYFSKTASKVKGLNMKAPMRGGIRL